MAFVLLSKVIFMKTDTGHCILIYSTVPDLLLGKRIAHVLVEEKLAACVNLSAPGLSIYQWENVVEGNEEITLTIKTTQERQQACFQKIAELHPYDVPEIIAVPIIGGHTPYLYWVQQQTKI